MERLVGTFKPPHKSNGHLAHSPSPSHCSHAPQFCSSSGIPAIQITQMTIDEGTDDEDEAEPSNAAKMGGGMQQKCTKLDESAPKEECSLPAEAGKDSSAHAQADSSLLSANKYKDRSAVNRQSTGTLNRLILVAQALESEVDWRRRNDVNSSRIVFILRMANIVLLLLINLLIYTGVGQYHDRNGTRISLFLTPGKWNYKLGEYPLEEVPPTFSEMRLTGQFCAAALAMFMLFSTVLLQCVHCFRVRHSKLLCIFYAFACVPVSLYIFGLEMHYSACPWLDDFYQSQLLRRNFHSISMEKYFDTQCGINGWALAGIFSLLSCGLFVSDGLISAFFRADDSHEREKPEAIL